MKIGVLALQGDVKEHLTSIKNALKNLKLKGKCTAVRTKNKILDVDALIIPGGESTTIGKLIKIYGLDSIIERIARNGVPIMGTCAGLVLLAREGDEEVNRIRQELLGLMSIKIRRNAFGRQRESFEVDLKIDVLGEEPYHCVFIRAPVIERVWGRVNVLAEYKNRIVAAQEDNLIALSFHPELSNDTRMHEYFIRMIK